MSIIRRLKGQVEQGDCQHRYSEMQRLRECRRTLLHAGLSRRFVIPGHSYEQVRDAGYQGLLGLCRLPERMPQPGH